MKPRYRLLLFGLLLVLGTQAQTTLYTVGYIVNPAVSCHSGIKVCTTTGNNPENGGIKYVDWGDGTIDSSAYNQAANTSDQCHFFFHDYQATGIYHATVTVYSNAAGGMVPGNMVVPFTITNLATCEYFVMGTFETPMYTIQNGVPYDVTDVNGITTTITPVSSTGLSFYFGLDAANAPYTASINDAWLAANNKIQSTPDFVISNFNSDGSAYNLPQNMQVVCNDTVLPTDLVLNSLTAYSFIAPLQTGHLLLNICNVSCATVVDAQVAVAMPSGFIPNTGNLSNPVFQNDTLYFDVDSIVGCTTIPINITFPGTIQAGTSVSFSAHISNTSEVNMSNNDATATAIVQNSFDPNEKSCNRAPLLSPDETELLQYQIHCQNDGNFPALNVIIRDTISPYLDLSSFKVLNSSHPLTTSVDPATREIVFYMYNAQLAPSSQDLDASQGFVTYEIRESSTIPLNTPIENTGYIFFDYNPAIVTNTTSHSNGYLGLTDQNTPVHRLFPNPTNDIISLADGVVADIAVYDLNGRLLFRKDQTNSLTLSSLAAGMYRLVITSPSGTSVHAVSKL